MSSNRSVWMAEKALSKLRDLPRVSLNNLWKRPDENDIWPIVSSTQVRFGQVRSGQVGSGQVRSGQSQGQGLVRLGYLTFLNLLSCVTNKIPLVDLSGWAFNKRPSRKLGQKKDCRKFSRQKNSRVGKVRLGQVWSGQSQGLVRLGYLTFREQ